MKGKIIAIAVALVMFVGLNGVMASTTVDEWWSGSGNFMSIFNSGDDFKGFFDTGGTNIWGELHWKDYDDNPYGYNVDTNFGWTHASVSGGGWINFITDRLDSKSSYGPAGQESWTNMYTSDGDLEMAWYSSMNYARMTNCQYGHTWTTNGKNFEGSGSFFSIVHGVDDHDGDGAWVGVMGSGSAMLKLQGETAGQNSGFNLGRLPVCGDGGAWHKNYATFSGTGNMIFDVHALAHDGLNVGYNGFHIPGDGTFGSAFYDLKIGFSGTFNWDDYGISGD